MLQSTKAKLVSIFTIVALVLTAFQGLIPMMPLSDTTLISAIVMFLVSGLTAWKQALSQDIANTALWPTIIVAIVATLGGLNDLFNVIPVADKTGQWIRFGITAITAILNILSNILWPKPSVG